MLSLFTYHFQLLSEAIVDIHILWYEYHPQYHNSYQPIKRDRFKANKICEKFILSKEQWVERENYDTIIWFHEVYTHLLMLEKTTYTSVIQWREEITLKAMKILFILIFKAMKSKRMGI